MATRTHNHWIIGLVGCALLLVPPACGPDPSSGGGTDDAGGTVDSSLPEVDASDPTLDDDGDGYNEEQGDCDDSNPAVHPGAEEICGDGLDNDCDGNPDGQQPDADGDGYGPCLGDCDDTDPNIHPRAQEIPGNGKDDNCDGIVDADFDGDGWTEQDGDCDDTDPTRNPGVQENCFDGIDNDCNGATDSEEPDMDGDGFGPCSGDCDDSDPNRSPDLAEIPNDGIDNNCDFLVDEDIDGDGWTEANGDCNDEDPSINPSVPEDCSDGVDNNCDGQTDQGCLSPCEMAARMRLSVGCTYYAVDTNPIHSFVAGDYAVAISNIDETQTANVVIEVKNQNSWTTVANGSFTVAPLALHTTVLPHRYIDGSTIYQGGAYRITSDLPVVVYQFNPLDGSSSYLSDASLLLPTSAYDNYYLVSAWQYGPADTSNSGHPAHVQIVAMTDTTVTVTSPVPTTAGNTVPALQPGVSQSFQLAEGDYLQLTVANLGDSLEGMYVEADHPVALFAANDCSNVPASSAYCCCEHLEEQIFGLQTWGRHYVASRIPQRIAEPCVWDILAAEDDTTVNFTADSAVTGLSGTVTLNSGEHTQLEVSGPSSQPGDFYVDADKPILVTQYMVGCYRVQSGYNNGDPSMVQAVPVEQYLDHYVVLVPSTWQNDYLVLTRSQGESVSIDGNAVTTGWTAVGSSGYEVSRVSVADGVHVLQGSAPFGVIVVGFDAYDSYAYPGGLNQQIINPIN